MSGAAIVDRQMSSPAVMNNKMWLNDTGANIAAFATPEAGMHAYCTATGSTFTIGHEYRYTGSAWVDIHAIGYDIVIEAQMTATGWTDMPAALTEFLGNTRHRRTKNLTNVAEWRLAVNMTVAGFAGSKLGVQYSIDAGTTFRGMDNGTATTQSTVTLALDQGTNVSLVSAWAAINTQARINDCLLRISGSDGNGAIDPSFQIIIIEVR